MQLDGDGAKRLREALVAAGYTADGVAELLGPVAHAALARHETVPARRRTTGGGPLETLVRLFLLQLPVDGAAAARALPLDVAAAAGLVDRDGGQVRAALDLRPYGDDYYVVSDVGAGLDGAVGRLRPDHVLGVGGASATLSEVTVREPVRRALDIGTGSGVQALHLTEHADEVVGTDVLPHALRLARMTAQLSGVDYALREGSLYDPVAGERFDLVVSNPPFVVAPRGRFAYRDAGLEGDEVCARLVRGAADHLSEGGWFQCLANWLHRDGEDWRDRVAGWLPPGCDAHVVQREVADPAAYVSLWLHDAGDVRGPDHLERYDAWLAAFEAAGVEGVGFGWVTLRRAEVDDPAVTVEDWPHPVEQPMGPHLAGWGERVAWLRAHDGDDLLGQRLRVADDVRQEQVGRPGAEDPEVVVLRQERGMRRAERVGTALAGLVGACDGSLPVGVLVDAVAAVLAEDPADLRATLLPPTRRLVAAGLLLPAG